MINQSSIEVFYESGCVQRIHLPDPSFPDGYVLLREFIDISDPDEGVWVDREYLVEGEQGGPGAFAPVIERTRVLSPEELEAAVLVQVQGRDALRREPDAPARCGLANVHLDSLGFTEDDTEVSPDWLVAGVANMAERCDRGGMEPAEAFERGLALWRNRAGGGGAEAANGAPSARGERC